jgi:hypothetical protein
MAYVIGIALAPVIAFIGRAVGFDRDRAFYSTILIVIALYYVLFAAMGGSTRALIVESLLAMVFLAVAVIGFRLSPWIVVAGIGAHGIFDLVHPYLVSNPGVPVWWPAFCMSIDVALAAIVAALMLFSFQKEKRAEQ